MNMTKSYDEIADFVERQTEGYTKSEVKIICGIYSDAYKCKEVLAQFYAETRLRSYFEGGVFVGYFVYAVFPNDCVNEKNAENFYEDIYDEIG